MADNSILNRLDGLKLKYEETGQKLTDPEVIADVKQFVQLNKEYKELEPIIETSERYRTALANLAEAKDILSNDKDEEMREMARGEITELEPAIEQMEEQIKKCLGSWERPPEWMVRALNRAMEESSEPQLDAKSKVTNQLIDFEWKLGMAVSSDSCRSLKYP